MPSKNGYKFTVAVLLLLMPKPDCLALLLYAQTSAHIDRPSTHARADRCIIITGDEATYEPEVAI